MSDPYEHYKCAGCQDFCDNAVETGCCHTLLCGGCGSGTTTCPACLQDIKAPPTPNYPIRRIISKLQLPCTHSGCSELIFVPNRSTHAQQCPHRLMGCPFSTTCGSIKQGDLPSHRMECEYRPYSCACGLAFQYRTRATHDLTCPINKIPCPAACGKTLERRQLVRHAAPGQCSASLTLCPYHLAGCAFASSPSAVADHQAGAKEQHLAMLSSALAQSAARNAANEYQLSAARSANCGWSSLAVDVDTLVPLHRLHAHAGSVTAMTMADGLLVSSSEARDVRVWHHGIAGWSHHRAVFDQPSICTCLCALEGSLVCGGFEDGSLRLLDVHDDAVPVQQVDAHDDTVWAVAATSRGNLFSASADGTIRQWRLQQACRGTSAHAYARVADCSELPKGHTAPVVALAAVVMEPPHQAAAAAVANAAAAAASAGDTTEAHRPWVLVLSGSEDTSVCCYGIPLPQESTGSNSSSDDAGSGASDGKAGDGDGGGGSNATAPAAAELLRTFRGHTDTVWAIAVDMAHRVAFTGSGDGSIGVLALSQTPMRAPTQLKALTGHTKGVRSLAIAWPQLFSCSWDRCLRIWNVQGQDRLCLRVVRDVDWSLVTTAGLFLIGSIGRRLAVWGATQLNARQQTSSSVGAGGGAGGGAGAVVGDSAAGSEAAGARGPRVTEVFSRDWVADKRGDDDDDSSSDGGEGGGLGGGGGAVTAAAVAKAAAAVAAAAVAEGKVAGGSDDDEYEDEW